MKKQILFIVLSIASLQAFSQTFSVGGRLGLNMASIQHYISQFDDDKILNGQFISFHSGIVTNITIGNTFSIQPEFLFSKKGHDLSLAWDTTDYSQDGYQRIVMNYLEVPVLLKASFGPSEVRFFVNTGPYWGLWMGGKNKYKLSVVESGKETSNVKENTSIDFEKDWEGSGFEANKQDFGWALGGGFAYQTGPGALLIDFRYTLGFRDIQNWIAETPVPDTYKEMRHRVFSISFAYIYEF